MTKRQNFWYLIQTFVLTSLGFSVQYTCIRREWFSRFELELRQKNKRFIIINKFVKERKYDMSIRRYELWLR